MPTLTAPPSVLQEVESLLQEYDSQNRIIPNVSEYDDSISTAFIQDAASSYSIGSTAAVQIDTRAAASSFLAANSLPRHQGAIATYHALSSTRQMLAALFQRLPRVIAKGGDAVLRVVDARIKALGSDIAHAMAGDVVHYMRAHVQATSWSVQQSNFGQQLLQEAGLGKPINYNGVGPLSVNDVIKGLENSVNYLLGEYKKLAYSVGIHEHSQAIPPQLWNQIHNLQGTHAATDRAVDHLNDRINALDARQGQLENQYHQLATELHGLRQVSAGWQDIKDELDRLGTTVTARQNQQAVQIGSLNRTAGQLMPLTLLLQPGIRGLRTLRQLEDTPCMCPKPKELSGGLALALALEQGMLNGF